MSTADTYVRARIDTSTKERVQAHWRTLAGAADAGRTWKSATSAASIGTSPQERRMAVMSSPWLGSAPARSP